MTKSERNRAYYAANRETLLAKRRERTPTKSSAPDKSTYWKPEDFALALRMKDEGKSYDEIAAFFGRGGYNVRQKFQRYKNGLGVSHRGYADCLTRLTMPESVVADRDERMARNPRDLTAAIFGDPLPGYSALERRA